MDQDADTALTILLRESYVDLVHRNPENWIRIGLFSSVTTISNISEFTKISKTAPTIFFEIFSTYA